MLGAAKKIDLQIAATIGAWNACEFVQLSPHLKHEKTCRNALTSRLNQPVCYPYFH